MSNIGNQVVAIAATLLGFVAHDYLSEAKTIPALHTNRIVAAADVDPIVTRSLNMGDLSLQSIESAAVAPAARPHAPTSGITVRTAVVKFDDVESAFVSINDVRNIRMPVETSISGRDSGYIR